VNARKIGLPAGLLVFYTLAFIIFTYPLVLDFGSCFISDGKDGCVFVWNIYNFRDSVLHFRNPFTTDKIFYPVGSSLVFHVYAPVTGIAGLFTTNYVLALNLTVLLSFVFSGLGGYLLCNHYVRNRLLAAIAGFIFAYCPYKLLHLYGHYDLLLTAAIPFFVLYWIKAFAWEEPLRPRRFARPRIESRRNLALALVFYVITLFSCYYYAYFLMIFVILYLLYYGLRLYQVRLFTKRTLVYIGLAVIISTLAVGFLHLKGYDKEGPTRIGLGSSADVLAFVVPSAYSRFLASDLVEHIRLSVIRASEVESTVYIGHAILVFVIAYFVFGGPRREERETKILSFMTGAYLVFAMPIVLIADRIICALPTALIHYLPFINNFRVPYRFDIMIMLFAPILGCLFIKRQVLPRAPARLHLAFGAALVALLTIEYMQMPYPMVCRRDVPKAYDYLAEAPDGVLLEIPFGLRDGFRTIGDERTTQMYYQTIHHKRILGGLVSRPSKYLFGYFQKEPVVSDLLKMEEDPSWRPARYGPVEVAKFLETFGIRYVLIYPEYRNTGIAEYLEAELSPYVVARDEIDGFALLTLAPAVSHR